MCPVAFHMGGEDLVTLANSETPVLQPIGMSFVAFTPVDHHR